MTLQAATVGLVRVETRWWRRWQLWALVLLVMAIYLPRLTERPMRGEDSRRATIANEMFDTGNWIVPTQQHVPYLSRPPLHSWMMAGLSYFTGSVDYLAIRLPSVFGVLGMALLVYGVSLAFVGPTAALVGGAAIASMPQVIELGRFGETDAMFSFLVSASLLIWLAGYQRKWPIGLVWSLGYGLAAFGTLTKGIQALPYFAGATWLFLAWRRDWRWLFSKGHLLGILTFAVIFGAWAIPFVHAMGIPALVEIFRRDSKDQWKDISVGGFARQMITMPIRVAGSVLPWVVLLLLFLRAAARRYAGGMREAVLFLLIAMVLAWLTVWLSPTAQNRHFMPLYPCIAVLVAFVAGAILQDQSGGGVAKGWQAYAGILSIVIFGAGLGFSALAAPAVIHQLARALPRVSWTDLQLSWLMGVVFLTGSLIAGAAALWASRQVNTLRVGVGALAIAAFMGLLMVGPVQSLDEARAVDIRPDVARLKEIIGNQTLVSYGPTAHLFAYYYRNYIPIVALPKGVDDPGAKVDYFCYYGGSEGTAEPKLPFAWDKVGEFCCDRIRSNNPKVLVVVGRRRAS